MIHRAMLVKGYAKESIYKSMCYAIWFDVIEANLCDVNELP